MKAFKIFFICTLAGILTMSCENFDELNTDPNRMDQVTPGALLNPVLYELSVFNWNRSNSFTMELMQVSLPTNSSGGVSRYIFNDNTGNSTWNTYYQWLNNIREMENLAVEFNEPNYQAIALTLKSWVFQLLADSFGDVPMSEANRGDEGLLQPKFDTQEQIYTQILADLEQANSLFNTATGLRFNTDGELLFGTDEVLVSGQSAGMVKWKKFCNSLRLRVAMRMVNSSNAKAKSEIEAILGDPTRYPVFTGNNDAALLPLSGVFPQEPPMTRPQDFTSYRGVASFFIDNLNTLGDPRRDIFCTKVNGQFIGWPSGYNVAPTDPATPSNMNQNLAKAPLKVVLMPYAEIEFIKAEAAFYGWNTGGGTAKSAYEAGVRAAIEQWGAAFPADYFANTAAAFNNTLERIMLQKYYALFFCDCQQWFEHMRTGYPVLPRGDGVPAGNQMPNRFKYPETIQRTNMTNYQEAKQRMGGDTFNNKLWWQK
ncbi:MAG: SusD/RagB family nutrient-binding outer membrane lipoprotein [Mangrovibacterium sp.]